MAPRDELVPDAVLAVRRWARTNLLAVLIVAGLSIFAVVLIPPTALDRALDWLILATGPVVAVLELALLLAVFRLFRDRDRTLAILTIAAGGASIGAGLVATIISLAAEDGLEAWLLFTAGGVLTAAELGLLSLLLRRAAAEPARLWLWGLVAGIGVAFSSLPPTAPTLLALPGLLALAFPVFLYRLGQVRIPAAAAEAAA